MMNDLCNGLCDEYEIVIAYSKRNQTPEDFRKMFDPRIKFIEVKNFTRNINPIKDFRALIELKKIIKAEKPQTIHLHSSKSGVLGRLAASGKKYKIIYNPHGFSFLKLDDSKIKRLIYKTIEWIMAKVNPQCTIVGCSKGEYNEARKISKNSVQIDNAINIENLDKYIEDSKDVKEIDFNNLKICTVGRIGYQKNPKEFNEIAESLPNAKFTWIGDGELRNELTAKNITITGWKKRSEVLELVSKEQIFILSSAWEGLPMTLLEAGYMNKLCIVSNVIGNRDVVENNRDGYIYNNFEDVEKFLKTLNTEKYLKMTNRMKEKIKRKFNINLLIKKYKEQYGE